jgi:3-hydroxybutyryl-CoA dehydrogenase
MTIKTIGVIGAGIMGSGIAQVFASKGFNVILQDIKDEFCERGLSTIKKSLGKMLAKERISQEDHDKAISNITITTSIADLQSADFAVEAATENVDLKLEIFKKLDATLPKDAILATNTSSIPITKIADATSRPTKVIGMHFMNPVPIMKGVEIIRGKETDKDVEEVVVKLAKELGKTVVRSNDFPGFIANRILMPMINEAAYALHDGVAEKEDIDTCMIACCNFPMGPLALADLIGLDTVVAILNVIYDGFGDEKYKPCPLLLELVQAGSLGKKSGKGFYDYTRMP